MKLAPRKIRTGQAPLFKRKNRSGQPQILGLTGSIGMGKSTAAQMFREEGIPVFDADLTVHDLYNKTGSEAALLLAQDKRFRKSVLRHSTGLKVDRSALADIITQNPEYKSALEGIIHPLVAAKRQSFIRQAAAHKYPLIVLDIPLLYEVGIDAICDFVLVVTASQAVQKSRLLSRRNLTEERINFFLKNQMPDQEKRRMADFVINTGHGRNAMRTQVKALIRSL
tara:strand:+ start:169 stop:843 length:675 start_codon:yes stop_codon:yes gene_type:complete